MSDWITIQIFMYPHEASIAQAKLESLGIESFLQDELTAQVISGYSNAIGGARLQVPRNRYEEAKKILINGGFLKDETIHILNSKDYNDKTICPFCKSENIDSLEKPNPLSLILYFFSKFVFLFKPVDHCGDCNKSWKYKK
jgi:hypothetical protein